jgi:hypothetical protein
MKTPINPAVVSGDVIAAGAVAGTLMNILPPMAAAMAIIWYAIQIYESKTVQARVAAFTGLSPERRATLCAVFMTAFRDALKLGGAYLVATGAVTTSDVQFWSGLATIASGVIWSAVTSWRKHNALVSATKGTSA